MKYNSKYHHRHSIRLPGHDYSCAGIYFITLCTRDRACLFGDVVNGQMKLNDAGRIAADAWKWMAEQYPYVEIHEWVVMPNHLHGIIVIHNTPVGAVREPPLPRRKPLGRLIGAFKTVSTKHINQIRGTPGLMVWQRNYYEHITRDKESLDRIRKYIACNPAQWASDKANSFVLTPLPTFPS